MATDAPRSTPRVDQLVVGLVIAALAALIVGFAANAPAFSSRGSVSESSALGFGGGTVERTIGGDPVNGGSDGSRQED